MDNTRTRGKRRNYKKLYQAADYFVNVSRQLSEIALELHVQPRTIRGYAKDPAWQTALDDLGYSGERCFEKKPTRRKKDTEREDYKHAKYIYRHLCHKDSSIPPRKYAYLIEKHIQIPRKKINRWAKQENWLQLPPPETSYRKDMYIAENTYKEERKFLRMGDNRVMSIGERFTRRLYSKPEATETEHCLYWTAIRTGIPLREIQRWQEEGKW